MNLSTPLVAATGGLRLGGSTTFLLNLGRAFRERGLDLPVVSMSVENEMAADFARAQVKVHSVMNPRLIFEDRLGLAYKEIAAKNPNGVLACLGGDSFELLRTVPKGVARIGVIQSDDPAPYQMAREFVPWLDALVGVSERICQRLREEGFGARMRIEQIPYGIQFDPGRVLTVRDAKQPLRIIYIGRIIETQKRVSRLVELINLLAAGREKFEFTFVGSGPELPMCEEALRTFSQVRFLRDVPNAEINGLLRTSDVFVLLSDFEGLPLSLMEAMGEGVVPVVSDLESGMRQVVTQETGVRVPIGDVQAAANAISTLAREPTRQFALATAASEFVRREFSASKMAERYLKLVGEIARENIIWPEQISVPVPVGYGNNWLLKNWSRPLRRILKRAKTFTAI